MHSGRLHCGDQQCQSPRSSRSSSKSFLSAWYFLHIRYRPLARMELVGFCKYVIYIYLVSVWTRFELEALDVRGWFVSYLLHLSNCKKVEYYFPETDPFLRHDFSCLNLYSFCVGRLVDSRVTDLLVEPEPDIWGYCNPPDPRPRTDSRRLFHLRESRGGRIGGRGHRNCSLDLDHDQKSGKF